MPSLAGCGLDLCSATGLATCTFPNPYMPPMVARSHFIEIASSMLLYGSITGWVMAGKEEQNVAISK
ncbi:MAG: hypothetical protein JXA89_12845 [Anaerolineae bacterium]|nr:hypothetical protein [Anaerolineae bacterium]